MFSKRLFPGFLFTFIVVLAMGLAACGGSNASSQSGGEVAAAATERPASLGDSAKGEEEYNKLCIACHGPGGAGVEGLGKPFTTSEFVLNSTDEELLAFVKVGRPISDPANTTGVDMPPKGGNPALTDDQILDIIAYIRSVHE